MAQMTRLYISQEKTSTIQDYDMVLDQAGPYLNDSDDESIITRWYDFLPQT